MWLTWKEKKKGQLVLQCHFKSFLLEEMCMFCGGKNKKQETRRRRNEKKKGEAGVLTAN